ncbi:MAG TPA: AAA family ATPase [Acidimicrobiales bacterium]|nr:AAA family ATPase [Acidimicrobiales bacterium]
MSIDRLRAHYGFSRMPFGKDLAPQMLHAHRTHEEAVARISWCVAESAIGVITGECGSGKTVAARAATACLDASRYSVIYLGTPAIGARGTYTAIVSALGGRPRFHCASLIPQCQELLVAESAERRKHVVIVLDESHLLDSDTLDGLRCLANIDMDSAPLCMLLLDQPTLRRRLRLGSFVALDQRVGLRYHLGGLDLPECSSYVAHHLALAGRKDTLFSDDAVALIHQASRGLPRAINNLAVQALVAAFGAKKGIVDESSARVALSELNAE